MKKALILILLLLALFLAEILIFEDNAPIDDEKPFIAVTNFALYDIATSISDKRIEVKKLIPFGVEVHTYMPSVKTMSELSKAEFFVYNGLGMEPWIKNDYSNGIDMSRFVQLREEGTSHDGHAHSENEHARGKDPHYWLDIDNMVRMTDLFEQKLKEHFPQHNEVFQSNARAYIERLRALDTEYKEALKSCKQREIVVNHNAFSYLAQRYGFSAHSVTGLSPDEQASAKKMKEITDLVKDEGIKTIFFESFVSPKVSETISKETGAQIESLQPLANVGKGEGTKGYMELMRENLHKLSSAMECE